MDYEEAARILDPETTREALAEIEYYGGFRGEEAVLEAAREARRIAAEVLRETGKNVGSKDNSVPAKIDQMAFGVTEYIERAAICKACKASGSECTGRDCEIPYIPAADVAPVVRCRECALHSEDAATGKLWCTKPMGCLGCLEVKPDDFCSRGKRH